MSAELKNVSNPAAFGIEWAADSARYQLVNIRDTASLIFGMSHEPGEPWTTTSVVRPERFGMTSAPKSYRAFLAIARAFVDS